jgi:UDP-N-acetyl-D-galactosamine dehydrogenase
VNGRTGSALVLGITFKEDVPDLRNSKVADLIGRLASLGHQVTVHDPHADAAEAMHEYGVGLDPDALTRRYDLVVLAVPHRAYRDLGPDRLVGLVADGGLFADLKAMVPGTALTSVRSWSL